MNQRIEDAIGRALIIGIFLLLAVKQTVGTAAAIRSRAEIEFWPLMLVSQIAGLIFVGLLVALTVLRLPSKKSAAGIEPRITAVAGTFATMLFIALPAGSPGPELRVLSTSLIVVGTALSIWCALFLGRSFSIVATARQLRTEGAYAIVRHPLYVAEEITIVGLVLAHWTVSGLLLGLAHLALQIRRAMLEERVLREVFPEYDSYAKRVPMFLPFG